jgi:hypothetical protein
MLFLTLDEKHNPLSVPLRMLFISKSYVRDLTSLGRIVGLLLTFLLSFWRI